MATVVPDDGSERAGAERRSTLFRAHLCEESELSVQIYARIVRNVHNIHLSSVLERSGATRKILRQNVTSVKIRHTILHGSGTYFGNQPIFCLGGTASGGVLKLEAAEALRTDGTRCMDLD